MNKVAQIAEEEMVRLLWNSGNVEIRRVKRKFAYHVLRGQSHKLLLTFY
jgi:hypothetical protein